MPFSVPLYADADQPKSPPVLIPILAETFQPLDLLFVSTRCVFEPASKLIVLEAANCTFSPLICSPIAVILPLIESELSA